MQWAISYPCSSFGRPRIHDASKMSSFYLVATKITKKVRSVQPNFIEEEFDGTTFADVDAAVIAVQPPPSDAEIVAELLETEGIGHDDDDYTGEVLMNQ